MACRDPNWAQLEYTANGITNLQKKTIEINECRSHMANQLVNLSISNFHKIIGEADGCFKVRNISKAVDITLLTSTVYKNFVKFVKEAVQVWGISGFYGNNKVYDFIFIKFLTKENKHATEKKFKLHREKSGNQKNLVTIRSPYPVI